MNSNKTIAISNRLFLTSGLISYEITKTDDGLNIGKFFSSPILNDNIVFIRHGPETSVNSDILDTSKLDSKMFDKLGIKSCVFTPNQRCQSTASYFFEVDLNIQEHVNNYLRPLDLGDLDRQTLSDTYKDMCMQYNSNNVVHRFLKGDLCAKLGGAKESLGDFFKRVSLLINQISIIKQSCGHKLAVITSREIIGAVNLFLNGGTSRDWVKLCAPVENLTCFSQQSSNEGQVFRGLNDFCI